MKKTALFLAVLGALILSGCGGSSGAKTSTVTGTVYDQFVNPVIGATVFSKTGSTTSSTSGAFVLPNQPDDYVVIEASLVKKGVKWHGSSIVFNSAGTQSTSVGIVMAPESELCSLLGTVVDRFGDPIQDASVFAYSSNGGTSQRAITGKDGEFVMDDLVAGINYKVSATGQTFRSDQVSVTLGVGERRTVDFSLGDAGFPTLSAPTDLSSVTYVSYPVASRAIGTDNVDWVKKHMAKKSSAHAGTLKTRAIRTDMRVEGQLDWLYNATTETQGFGIYRSAGNVAKPSGLDFFYDPLATTYFDSGLQPSSTYTYAVTSTSSFFPQDPDATESALSNTTIAKTLNLLPIGGYTASTKKFTWSTGSGATSYIVYVFDEFPSADRIVFASNESTPVATTSWTYTGPTFTAGHTYYWFVLGLA
ncbi:MAG: carboxypeptidase-like regulatory domain-containing protein, partial [Armatimonadota bacterium]